MLSDEPDDTREVQCSLHRAANELLFGSLREDCLFEEF